MTKHLQVPNRHAISNHHTDFPMTDSKMTLSIYSSDRNKQCMVEKLRWENGEPGGFLQSDGFVSPQAQQRMRWWCKMLWITGAPFMGYYLVFSDKMKSPTRKKGLTSENLPISLQRHGYLITVVPWYSSSQWRHNVQDGVSNHQPHHCFLNRLFRRKSKKTSKFRVTGLCAGNSPVTGEFPAQMASNAENVSIWWRHHDIYVALNDSRDVYVTLGSFGACTFAATMTILVSRRVPPVPLDWELLFVADRQSCFRHMAQMPNNRRVKNLHIHDRDVNVKNDYWGPCY